MVSVFEIVFLIVWSPERVAVVGGDPRNARARHVRAFPRW
jgi:hypothetical protein